MKRWFFLTLLAFSSLSLSAQFRGGYETLNDSETVAALKEHISYIASTSMQGRAPGSEGEKETALYVTEMLKSYTWTSFPARRVIRSVSSKSPAIR